MSGAEADWLCGAVDGLLGRRDAAAGEDHLESWGREGAEGDGGREWWLKGVLK